MKKIILMVLLSCLFTLFAQEDIDETMSYQPEELISISRNTNIVAALRAIEVISLQFENKKIITTSSNNEAVGIPVHKLYWKDALELIVQLHNLDLEERPGSYMVTDPMIEEELGAAAGDESLAGITPLSKQVRISSIFFKTDKTLSRDIGIDWSTLFGGDVVAQVNFKGANSVSDDIFNAATSYNMQTGNVNIQLDVLLRILEQYQKGSVVARPSVTVLSGKNGTIQVGQDFSVKRLDEAGNTTESFFSTGIILNVTPTIIERDGEEAIFLSASVEKSSASPGTVTTIIDKSSSSTDVLLFDGEETVIGGLYDTDRQTVRAGVPILKDLPWWLFGLRYIFGYNSYSVNTNEMIIVLKAEIIDPVSERKDRMQSLDDQIQHETDEFNKAKETFKNQ
ncbi:MAG: type II and III secretion system protein [Candidatus Cloacimonetes bacterium]|nr:type II and III secretion system protein [Candidatus Cloacimonadota bacterium]MCF7813642.1 type II and III secretion system protein [Candidatus Cloacimonadota bacterium]MCF7868321.1 type II and III secretion system protein [Candidatus Cloacimonadota bacterium]MCF7883795.1 type II and III secretion system protein [Candidatus Cloacimonadota bacterium]